MTSDRSSLKMTLETGFRHPRAGGDLATILFRPNRWRREGVPAAQSRA